MKPLLRVLPLLVPMVLLADSDLERGVKLAKERHYEEARSAFESASRAGSAEADARLSRLYLSRYDDIEKGLELAERAVKRDGGSAYAHLSLGMAYGTKATQSGMFKAFSLVKKVRDELRRAVELDPSSAEARLLLFDFYRVAPGLVGGGIGKAKDLADETLRTDEMTGHRMRMALLLKEKNPGAAEEELKRALSLAPANTELRNVAGYFYVRVKRFPEAVAQFHKLIELDPSDPNGHDSLAEALLAQGAPAESVSEYRKAVEMDRAFVSSWYGLGQALEAKGEKEEAARCYCECKSVRPRSFYAREAEKRLKALRAAPCAATVAAR
jgi:tetratricopeptide (TPR) repeat protein